MRSRWIGAALAVLALAAATAAAAQDTMTGLVAAVSDGRGTVRLLWPIPDKTWPAGGYTVERVDGKGKMVVVATGLRPNYDKSLTQDLEGSRREPLERLDTWDREVASGRNPGDYEGLKNFLFLFAAMDYPLARAMGIAWIDRPDKAGPFTYRLTAPAGGVIGLSLPVDPHTATPLGDAPSGLTAEATPHGVKLSWDASPQKPGLPVLSYRVKRDTGDGLTVISKGPILAGQEDGEGNTRRPAFDDTKAPADQEVRYVVVGVDVFGRETPPTRAMTLFVPDFQASYPPKGLKSDVRPGKILLSWIPSENPRTAGYIVERANFEQGPFVPLTQALLAPKTSSYTDGTTQAGQRYYYRLTARDKHGRTGAPSSPVMAVARTGKPPAAPANLRATLGVGRITLAWDRVPDAQVYRVERADDNSDRWMPASTLPTPEPRFVLPIVTGQSGTVRFRVVPLAADGTAGDPSNALDVALPRNRPPSAPHFTSFDGTGGRALLHFVPTGDASAVAGFFVLRSDSLTAPREVLQVEPLPPTARSYTDTTAEAGSEYVYRVVAVDNALNRSEASDPVTVLVGETSLPAPPLPSAAFSAGGLPKVTITFQPPPGMNLTFVQRRLPGENTWTRVAGPVFPENNHAADMRPPASGEAQYRIYYQTPKGTPGPPSGAVTVKIDEGKGR